MAASLPSRPAARMTLEARPARGAARIARERGLRSSPTSSAASLPSMWPRSALVNGTVRRPRWLTREGGNAEGDLRKPLTDEGGGQCPAAHRVRSLVERVEDLMHVPRASVGEWLQVVGDAHDVADPAPHVRHGLLLAGGVSDSELLDGPKVQGEEGDAQRGGRIGQVQGNAVSGEVPLLVGEHVAAHIGVNETNADRRGDAGPGEFGAHSSGGGGGDEPLSGLEQALAGVLLDPAGAEEDLGDAGDGVAVAEAHRPRRRRRPGQRASGRCGRLRRAPS